MTQRTFEFPEPSAPEHRLRRAREERMRALGIRPSTRYTVLPEDSAPPVPLRSPLAAFLARVWRRFR